MVNPSTEVWKTIKIGDLCTVGRGSSPRPIKDQTYFKGGTIPWIKIADATKSGKYLYETRQYVNEYGASFSRILPKGSLIVAASGTLGYTQLLGIDGCIHDGWLYLANFNDDVEKGFLYYLFKHRVQFFYNSAYGAAIQNVNTTILREMEISLPPFSTQRKISAVLSAYDDLIENNTRRIAILEEMAQTLYREWFVHFRFPGHEDVKMVEVEGYGRVPEGWDILSISSVADVSRGRSYRSVNLVEEGGFPFLNLKCIDRDGGFRREGLKLYDGPFKETQSAKPGDIIMAVTDMTQERRIIARAAIVPEMDHEQFVCSMDLVKIIPRPSLSSEFLYCLFRYSEFADTVKEFANGANVLHLKPKHIEDFEFALPPSELIENFSTRASRIYREIDILFKKNGNLRQTRDLLLPRLISGELDVSDLEIAIVNNTS